VVNNMICRLASTAFSLLMTELQLPAIDAILNKICLLVTAAFALTLVPGLRGSEQSLLSVRDRGTALLVFMFLGMVEQAAVGQTGLFNHRIVAVCAAGLLAGPEVGAVVALFVTTMAILFGRPLGPVGVSMMFGGLAGGCLNRWRPKMAQHPLTGFCLTSTMSWTRDGLTFLFAPEAKSARQIFGQLGITPLLQGLGTALVLAIVALVRERDEQTQAAASAEVRALQARMNPHFLFNALNTLSALATIAPREIPYAARRLRNFLQASFEQHQQSLVPLEEELAVVRAYLDIESLRFGSRLKVEQQIDAGLAEVLIPPFSLQPVVENAVQHGLQHWAGDGCLCLVISRSGKWLDISVGDNGKGVAPEEVEKVFFAARPQVHALGLLRRRLQGLFGRAFKLEIFSGVGQGTTVKIRLPLRRRVREGRK